jgi:hypothetical protein
MTNRLVRPKEKEETCRLSLSMSLQSSYKQLPMLNQIFIIESSAQRQTNYAYIYNNNNNTLNVQDCPNGSNHFNFLRCNMSRLLLFGYGKDNVFM